MGKWGKVDIKGLEAFQQKFERLTNDEIDLFIRSCAKGLAARLLAKVIAITPVGQYDKNTGKTGGTLQRGWTATTEEEAAAGKGSGMNAQAYVDELEIEKANGFYFINIINPVFYASYVEHGHRTANHEDWVEGHHMLKISEKELQSQAPGVLEKKLETFLKEKFKE